MRVGESERQTYFVVRYWNDLPGIRAWLSLPGDDQQFMTKERADRHMANQRIQSPMRVERIDLVSTVVSTNDVLAGGGAA